MSTKMGRPLSDNPRKNVVGCKLTDEELYLLEQYCLKNKTSKSKVLKNGIKPIITSKSDGN